MISMIELVSMVLMASAIPYSNPVKLSITLIFVSSMIFLMMVMKTGSVWMPLLFFLLFMGGILMMFMILSSVLPNEKMIKNKVSSIPLIFTATLLSSQYLVMKWDSGPNAIKAALNQPSSLSVMTLILIMYFFSTIQILSKEELPMRASMCY